jgi:formylglycine-generating enzyme required for sulfatase activity
MEWEYAARGNELHRTYPWGNVFYLPAPSTGSKGTLRQGIFTGPFPVDDDGLRGDDSSAFGVVAMGTNVAEWTLGVQPVEARGENYDFEPLGLRFDEVDLSVAHLFDAIKDREAKIRSNGASFTDTDLTGLHTAKLWESVDREPRGRYPHVGIRLVRVAVAR